MLRITHKASVMLTTVDLDGKLVGPWVDEVRSIVTALRASGAVRLNLAHLSFADAPGLEWLRSMRRDGVHLSGVSPLIEGLLAASTVVTLHDVLANHTESDHQANTKT